MLLTSSRCFALTSFSIYIKINELVGIIFNPTLSILCAVSPESFQEQDKKTYSHLCAPTKRSSPSNRQREQFRGHVPSRGSLRPHTEASTHQAPRRAMLPFCLCAPSIPTRKEECYRGNHRGRKKTARQHRRLIHIWSASA